MFAVHFSRWSQMKSTLLCIPSLYPGIILQTGTMYMYTSEQNAEATLWWANIPSGKVASNTSTWFMPWKSEIRASLRKAQNQTKANSLLYSTKELKHQQHSKQVSQTFPDAVVVCEFPSNTEPSSDSMLVEQPDLGRDWKQTIRQAISIIIFATSTSL